MSSFSCGTLIPLISPCPPSFFSSLSPFPSKIIRLAIEIRSGDPQRELEATRGLRKVLSMEKSPPVPQVLSANVMDVLVAFLGRNGNPELQFEAAWALTNIASTDFTRVVVEFGATPLLVELLRSPNEDVREQCIWCLGNIAGDCAELRDAVLRSNALEPLLLNIAHPHSPSMLRNAVWSLSNFCRGKPQPALDLVKPAVPALAHVR